MTIVARKRRFVLYVRGGRYYWRLLEGTSRVLAESPAHGFARRIDANNNLHTFRTLDPNIPIEVLQDDEPQTEGD